MTNYDEIVRRKLTDRKFPHSEHHFCRDSRNMEHGCVDYVRTKNGKAVCVTSKPFRFGMALENTLELIMRYGFCSSSIPSNHCCRRD